MKIAFALVTASAFAFVAASSIATASLAGSAVIAPSPASYIAVALADGPSAAQRINLSFRGTNATDVIKVAMGACYRRAALGYLHTCQVWYGDAWVVGTACELKSATAADASAPALIRYGIGDDPNSPEAAEQKAIETIRKAEHAEVANCHVVAEYNANDMQTARSVATDDR